ncbi:conjugal transfer protein TraF [Thalassotalea sp. PLHSN55]|uniref:conjugal transfer protein TraF n=1 Tax=Thalassotalea sp. PLHSN55 TaxID=3435888 RepID=UPI003F87BB8E
MKCTFNKITLILLACSLPAQADNFSAKRAGQGFTAITQDFTASISNPALLTKYDNDDDVYFALNIGILGADEHDVIDTSENIADNLDTLEDGINAIDEIPVGDLPEYVEQLNQQIDGIVNDLNTIDNKIVKGNGGINAQIIVPNQYLSFGMFANQYGRIGIAADYDQNDEQIMRSAILNGEFNADELQSQALGVGYSVTEAGFMLGYQAINHANYELSIGTKLKYQRLDLFYNRINIANFDDDEFDLTDDEYLTDDDGTNVDIGMYTVWGDERQWHFALVANNLLDQQVSLIEQDLTFNLDTTITAGLSYQNDWLTVATEVDLTEREHFKELTASKYAAIGIELRVYEHMQFRLGLRNDLNDNEADLYTAGIGISPWDVVSIDIAAFTGDEDNIGGALQLGVKI